MCIRDSVYGERKDGEKLIPEYIGLSPSEYPGDNEQYSVVGWDYDKRIDGNTNINRS